MLLLVGAGEQYESQCDGRSLGRMTPGLARWVAVVDGVNELISS
jgi:hypothetical protein